MQIALGKISLFPYDFAPSDWMFCDGSILPISENESLFMMLGTTYGGNGESTFGVPDLRAITPKNCNYCIAVRGNFGDQRYEGIVGETFFAASEPSQRNVKDCAGQSLAKSSYMMLDRYMGTRFGGDDKNIKLPDLRSKTAPNPKYVMTVDGSMPEHRGPREMFVGEIVLLPYDLQLDYMAHCAGTMLLKRQLPGLYNLLGDRFGSNDQQFAVPDLSSAAPKNFTYYIALQGVFPSRGQI
jgi:microcystin-dependent protein